MWRIMSLFWRRLWYFTAMICFLTVGVELGSTLKEGSPLHQIRVIQVEGAKKLLQMELAEREAKLWTEDPS